MLHGSHRCEAPKNLPKERRLLWQLALLAGRPFPSDTRLAEAVIDRVIDVAAVSLAAINRRTVANVRSQAVAHPNAVHPRSHGARIMGLSPARRFGLEWAACANTAAARELDFDDVFQGAATIHPASAIPAIVAAAQHCGRSGADIVRGVAVAYEINVALAKSQTLRDSGVNPIVYLGAAVAGGVGACLGLGTETVYRAMQRSIISAPFADVESDADVPGMAAQASRLAIEAIDSSMRGEALAACPGNALLRLAYEESIQAIDFPRGLFESRIREHAADHRVQDAHPRDSRPFTRRDCVRKFEALTAGIVSREEQQRFLAVVQRLPALTAGESAALNVAADLIDVLYDRPDGRGVF